jgi:hypothetical protein
MEKYVEMQLVFAMILLKNMLKCNLFLPWYCWKICWNATCSCYIVEKYVKMQLVLTMILLKNMLKCVKMQLVLTMILLKNMLKCNLFLPWYCWKIYWNATCSHHDIVEKYVEMQLVLAMILLKIMLKCNLFSLWLGRSDIFQFYLHNGKFCNSVLHLKTAAVTMH